MYERDDSATGPEDFATIDALRSELARTLERLGERLDEDALCPDPARTDWADVDAHVQATWAEVSAFVSEAQSASSILTPEEVETVHATAAQYAMEMAILLELTGDRKSAAEAYRKAAAIAPPGPVREEAEAAAQHPEVFGQIAHARFLHRHQQSGRADSLLKKIRTDDAALSRAVKALRDAPRPLGGAPSLSTINGIGFGMYGARDRAPDGTYVSTHCFCVLFVPLLPLGAYRVHREGGGYTFYAKLPLSPFARWWRRLLGIGIVAAIVLGLASSWWNQPERRLARAMEEVRAVEDVDARLAGYEAILQEYELTAPEGADALRRAILELLVGRVSEPLTADRIGEVERLIARWRSLGARAGDEVSGQLAGAIQRWAEQVGSGDLDAAQARAQLLALRPELLREGSRRDAEADARGAQLEVAQALRAEWPVAAFRRFAALLDLPAALEQADALALGFDEAVLLLELEPELTRWAGRTRNAAATEAIRERLAAARERRDDPERRAALEAGELEPLEAQLERFPDDAALLAAVADAKRGAGDAGAAVAIFGESAERPGDLAEVAQIALAHVLRDAGELERADALLGRLVAERMPSYQQAVRAYDTKLEAFLDGLDARAQQGLLPADLDSRLRFAEGDEEAQAIYREYVSEAIGDDPDLAQLRDRASALADVVPLSVERAMVKLMRAEGATGAEREALLEDAEAVFLSVRHEAEGSPDYHLGLGQVYHRMGRPEEGDAELQRAMAQGPPMQIAVARTYRELGLDDRAEAVASEVWSSDATADVKTSAAILLSLLAVDRDEEERWLLRAPQDLIFVRNGLDELRAERALEEGRFEEASQLYAQVAERWEEEAGRAGDAASSNNAALAHLRRYSTTGEDRALRDAVRLLEEAHRRAPESALSVSNLASAHEVAGSVAVLERFVRPSRLLLEQSEVRDLLGRLEDGPLRAEVRAAIDSERSLRRAVDLYGQSTVLAPNLGSGFEGALTWAKRRDDADRVQQIAGNVVQHSYEDARAREAWAAHVGREHVERDQSRIASTIDIRRRALERAARHGPTKAAAHFLLGRALMERAIVDRDATPLEEAIDQLRTAHATWDGLDTRWDIAWALLTKAVLSRTAADERLRVPYEERERRLSLELTLLELGRAGLLGEVAADPAAVEALALLRALGTEPWSEPALGVWAVAEALGDEELAAIHRPIFDSSIDAMAAAARAHLRPWDERRAKRLELLRGGPG